MTLKKQEKQEKDESASDHSPKKSYQITEFDVNPSRRLRIQVSEEEGCNFIEFTLYRKNSDGHFFPSRKKIKIPLALFPDLKKAMSQIEGTFAELGHSEDFETEEEQGMQIKFANKSEEEFAKILDFYRIKWLYEPVTFPISWDETGNISESFTPDFYLTEQDLFIELTTLKQSLVTRKNRKVKRLKDIYPRVNIKIFYGKDYLNLLRKYGIERGGK